MTDEEVAHKVNLYKLSNKTKSQKVRYYILLAVAELCRRSYTGAGSAEACSCKIEFLQIYFKSPKSWLVFSGYKNSNLLQWAPVLCICWLYVSYATCCLVFWSVLQYCGSHCHQLCGKKKYDGSALQISHYSPKKETVWQIRYRA